MKYLYPGLQAYKWLNPPPEKPKEKKIPVDKTYKIKYINNSVLKNTHNMSALRLLSGECNNEYLQCKITFQDTNLFLAYQREKIDKPLVWHVFSKELFSLNNCLKASIKKTHCIDFNQIQNSSLHGFLEITNIDHNKTKSKITITTTPLQRYSDYEIYKKFMAKFYAMNRGFILGAISHESLTRILVGIMSFKYDKDLSLFNPIYNIVSTVFCIFYSVSALSLILNRSLPERVSNTLLSCLLSTSLIGLGVYKFSDVLSKSAKEEFYPKISTFLAGSLSATTAKSLIEDRPIERRFSDNLTCKIQDYCYKQVESVLE